MGIGPHAIKLTALVHKAGLLKPNFSIIELGSQDFAPTLPAAHSAIQKEFGLNASEFRLPPDLYAAIGCSKHECIDLDGNYGAYRFDLNFDLKEKYNFDRQYDLVTNHGTTEHLLNQFSAFQNIHNLTSPGGVMIHALPFQGYQNHGMFNYNPSFFLDLSISNEYEVFGLFISVNDRLYAYDEDFLSRNKIPASSDVLILAVMIKKSANEFKVPYDGRYFSIFGKGDIAPLDRVGSTRRFSGAGANISGLDLSFGSVEQAESSVPYQFITPLWGEKYAAIYCDVTLPSQLSDGNLGAFADDEALYTIVTPPECEAIVRSSSAFADLQKRMPVRFLRYFPPAALHTYSRMTMAYNQALAGINGSQACFFLTADDFYSDGLFRSAKKKIELGNRVVMTPTLRVVEESFRNEIVSSEVKQLSGAQTVRMILRHEHRLATSCVVNDLARMLHRLPSQTIFRMENGYIGRWNVMHPLVVKVPARPQPIISTVDWNYPATNVASANQIAFVSDSDDGVIASLTPYGYSQNEEITWHGTRSRRTRNLKEWVDIDWALNFHVLQMNETVCLHDGIVDEKLRENGIREVDKVWVPFKRYIDANRIYLPPATRGSGLDMLTRAVAPGLLRRVRPLVRVARRRFFRSTLRRIYQIARRALPAS